MSKFVQSNYTHLWETTTRWVGKPGSSARLRPRLVELEDLEGIVELIADGSDFLLVEVERIGGADVFDEESSEFVSYDRNLGVIRRAGDQLEPLAVGPSRDIVFIGELVNEFKHTRVCA